MHEGSRRRPSQTFLVTSSENSHRVLLRTWKNFDDGLYWKSIDTSTSTWASGMRTYFCVSEVSSSRLQSTHANEGLSYSRRVIYMYLASFKQRDRESGVGSRERRSALSYVQSEVRNAVLKNFKRSSWRSPLTYARLRSVYEAAPTYFRYNIDVDCASLQSMQLPP